MFKDVVVLCRCRDFFLRWGACRRQLVGGEVRRGRGERLSRGGGRSGVAASDWLRLLQRVVGFQALDSSDLQLSGELSGLLCHVSLQGASADPHNTPPLPSLRRLFLFSFIAIFSP